MRAKRCPSGSHEGRLWLSTWPLCFRRLRKEAFVLECSVRNCYFHGGRDSQNPDCAFSIVDYNRLHPPSDS